MVAVRWRRGHGMAVVALLAVLGILCSALPASANSTSGQMNTPGLQHIAACIQNARTLSVLTVLDRSGSLSQTDPGGARYDGLEVVLDALADVRRRDGQELTVEVAVSAFSHYYESATDVSAWRRISGDDGDRQIEAVMDDVRERTPYLQDGGTAFDVALEGALADLADRGANDTCRVMLWFTDGAWDAMGDPGFKDYGDMCDPGGVLDQVRAAGITVVALRLDPGGSIAASPDGNVLPAMALGETGDLTCGTVPLPEGAAPGVFLDADDQGALRGLFMWVANALDGCTPTGDLGTYVDPGIRRVRIWLDTDPGGPAVTSLAIATPVGNITVPTQGSVSTDGFVSTAESDSYYVSAEIELPPGGAVGQWTVTAGGGQAVPSSDLSFCVMADLSLELVPGYALGAGTHGSVSFQARDRSGAPATFEQFSEVLATAVANDGDAQPRPTSAGADLAQGLVTTTIDTLPGDVRLDVTVSAVLVTESGLRLTPIVLTEPVVLDLGDYFPLVEPLTRLDLGETRRLEPAEGVLRLTGSTKGVSEVCLGAPTAVLVPAEAGGVAPSYQQGCLELAPGEVREVAVTVTPEIATTGAASAVLPIHLVAAPDPNGDVGEVDVNLPVVWQFTNPMDMGLFWLVVAAVVLLSALVPFGALILANRLTGVFDVGDLRIAVVDVMIDPDGRARRTPPIPNAPTALLDPGELNVLLAENRRRSYVPGSWGRTVSRRFGVSGLRFQARGGWHPLGAPRFTVTAPVGQIVLTNAGPSGVDPRTAPATPGLGFLTVVVASAAGGSEDAFPARLLVLTKRNAIPDDELDLRVRGEGVWQSMRDARVRSGGAGVASTGRGPFIGGGAQSSGGTPALPDLGPGSTGSGGGNLPF